MASRCRASSCACADDRRRTRDLTNKKRPGVPPATMCMGALRGAEAEHGKVSDEAGLGDRAFSAPVSFGAVIAALRPVAE